MVLLTEEYVKSVVCRLIVICVALAADFGAIATATAALAKTITKLRFIICLLKKYQPPRASTFRLSRRADANRGAACSEFRCDPKPAARNALFQIRKLRGSLSRYQRETSMIAQSGRVSDLS